MPSGCAEFVIRKTIAQEVARASNGTSEFAWRTDGRERVLSGRGTTRNAQLSFRSGVATTFKGCERLGTPECGDHEDARTSTRESSSSSSVQTYKGTSGPGCDHEHGHDHGHDDDDDVEDEDLAWILSRCRCGCVGDVVDSFDHQLAYLGQDVDFRHDCRDLVQGFGNNLFGLIVG
jgi:hypothetical protein